MTRYAVLVTALFMLAVPALAQGLDAPESEIETSTAPLKTYPSPFTKALAERFDRPVDPLKKLEMTGYGRTEMITLILISSESAKPWDELIKERGKGTKLRKIAEDAGLNYNDIFRRSEQIRKEINATLPPKPEKPASP
ncbi:MAG: hypothetical protein HY548_00905 [Elusimicrobia bacterium]|nr:hypothetical protein [Elusimicrobiota bacterium]